MQNSLNALFGANKRERVYSLPEDVSEQTHDSQLEAGNMIPQGKIGHNFTTKPCGYVRADRVAAKVGIDQARRVNLFWQGGRLHSISPAF